MPIHNKATTTKKNIHKNIIIHNCHANFSLEAYLSTSERSCENHILTISDDVKKLFCFPTCIRSILSIFL